MKRILAILLFLFAASPALAVQPSEMLKDPALEARARALSAELRCLVCQNQSIDDSDAPLAHDLRVLLREQLMKGQTDQQVMDFVVERYGDYVLLKTAFQSQHADSLGLALRGLAAGCSPDAAAAQANRCAAGRSPPDGCGAPRSRHA